MTLVEEISQVAKMLPPNAQVEVLDFAGYLLSKHAAAQPDEDTAWKAVSLTMALEGIEADEEPDYSKVPLKENWQQ